MSSSFVIRISSFAMIAVMVVGELRADETRLFEAPVFSRPEQSSARLGSSGASPQEQIQTPLGARSPRPQAPGEVPAAHGYCSPEPYGQAYSTFQPMLFRHGVIAPRAPGVESPHSFFQRIPPSRPGCVPPPVPPKDCLRQPAVEEIEAWLHHPPCTPPCVPLAPYSSGDFSPDPCYDCAPYDACGEIDIYTGKYQGPVQRPLLEFGFPLYPNGPIPPSGDRFGITNPTQPKFYLYGDYRAAFAYNKQNTDKGVLAHRLNLEWDLWLTATERIHMFTGPLQRGGNFMRYEFNGGGGDYESEVDFFDPDTDTLFFEGDLGAIFGGLAGLYPPFDMPIAVGLIPLLFQNGIWMDDAFLGAAVTVPARNSSRFDWANFDVTFFAGFDQVTSPAFPGTTTGANLFGATTFIEARGGYFELGYAYLDDTALVGDGYHNIGISYTRRYLNMISNSVRVIVNEGQGGPQAARTADGVLLLVENSFITSKPYNVIPYVNFFVGFDRPQSAARQVTGVLRNTGILFESDALTGYPTLDDTANDTYGAAIGIDLLSANFTQQLILEAAALQVMGERAIRNAPGNQYGLGMRYQIPISNAHIIRLDAMHGWRVNAGDLTGARVEFRWKF